PRHEQREGILTQRHRDAEVTQRRIFLPDCLINILFTHLNAAISRDVLPVNARKFAVMAEGPIDQIRDLLNQIDTLMIEPTEIDAPRENETVSEHS
ncbi:MAG: hypothetical protein AB1631_23910, partial [Acidobacteriota bacterium]